MRKFKTGIIVLSFVLAAVFMGGSLALAEDKYTTKDLNEQLVMATLWMQASAEYRALCYQSFNLAKMLLDAHLAAKKERQTSGGDRGRG